jgi:hypothetical protein
MCCTFWSEIFLHIFGNFAKHNACDFDYKAQQIFTFLGIMWNKLVLTVSGVLITKIEVIVLLHTWFFVIFCFLLECYTYECAYYVLHILKWLMANKAYSHIVVEKIVRTLW